MSSSTIICCGNYKITYFNNKLINIYVPFVEKLHINIYDTKLSKKVARIIIEDNNIYLKSLNKENIIIGYTCAACCCVINSDEKYCSNCKIPSQRSIPVKKLNVISCDGEMSCRLDDKINILSSFDDKPIIKFINKINESREYHYATYTKENGFNIASVKHYRIHGHILHYDYNKNRIPY